MSEESIEQKENRKRIEAIIRQHKLARWIAGLVRSEAKGDPDEAERRARYYVELHAREPWGASR